MAISAAAEKLNMAPIYAAIRGAASSGKRVVVFSLDVHRRFAERSEDVIKELLGDGFMARRETHGDNRESYDNLIIKW